MAYVTTRSKARRKRREEQRRSDLDRADISQHLNMTPTKGSKETLAAATALQRARDAAEQKDRAAAVAAEQNKKVWARNSEPSESVTSATSPGSPHASQLDWTREDGYMDTDADTEDNEEEDYEHETLDDEDEEYAGDDDAAALAAAGDSAAIAAADEDAESKIETPPDERTTPTQSDLDFIATDDSEGGLYDDGDGDYYPSTADDNDEEEEELLSELLGSGNLSEQQSARVEKRLRALKRGRAIARTLFDARTDINSPREEKIESISPPLKVAPPRKAAATAKATQSAPPLTRGRNHSKAATGKTPNVQEESTGGAKVGSKTGTPGSTGPEPTGGKPDPAETSKPSGVVNGEAHSAMPEPRYVPVGEYFKDPEGFERYAAWEKANPDDERVKRRSIDPEPHFVASRDSDIDRGGYYCYRRWALRQPDIARDQIDQCRARPGDIVDEWGYVPLKKTLPMFIVPSVSDKTSALC